MSNKPKNKADKKKPSNKEKEREAKRQRELVKEIIYPVLLKHAKNIEDGKNMCSALAVGLQAAYSKKILEYQTEISKQTVAELKLEDIMDKGSQFDRDSELLNTLKGEKLSTALSLLSGLQGAIAAWVKKETLKRGLDTLETDFL